MLSDAGLLAYESLSAARLTKPFLLIHGANCALPDQARRHFYDNPAAIDPAVTSVTDWFARHLGPGTRN